MQSAATKLPSHCNFPCIIYSQSRIKLDSLWAANIRKLVHLLLCCMQGHVLKTGRPLAPLPAILQKSSRGIGVKADWLDSIQQTYSLYLACIKPKSPQAVPGKLSWQVQCLTCCCSCQLLVHSYHCWTSDTLCFGHMTQS